jgi:hypothetical protein
MQGADEMIRCEIEAVIHPVRSLAKAGKLAMAAQLSSLLRKPQIREAVHLVKRLLEATFLQEPLSNSATWLACLMRKGAVT